jgi:hypothetical protein
MACQDCQEKRHIVMSALGFRQRRHEHEIINFGDEGQSVLFFKFMQFASGFSARAILGATINAMLYAIAASCPDRDCANVVADQMREKLADGIKFHYHADSGKKIQVTPLKSPIIQDPFANVPR